MGSWSSRVLTRRIPTMDARSPNARATRGKSMTPTMPAEKAMSLPPSEPVQAADTEERHGDDEEARDGAAPQRDPQRSVQGAASRRGRSNVGPDRDPHPDIAREDRAAGPEKEGKGRPEGEVQSRRDG